MGRERRRGEKSSGEMVGNGKGMEKDRVGACGVVGKGKSREREIEIDTHTQRRRDCGEGYRGMSGEGYRKERGRSGRWMVEVGRKKEGTEKEGLENIWDMHAHKVGKL